jgi:thiol peroxidase
MPTVTAGGNRFELTGDPVEVGHKARDFRIQLNDMSDYTLASGRGKTRIFACSPSLDTGVCDTEARRFNVEASKIPDVEIVFVTVDLPFAQRRWCGAAGVENVITASDHRDVSFGTAFGTLMCTGSFERFLCRAVFVVDPDDVIRYVEIVPDIASEPDYEAALSAAKG